MVMEIMSWHYQKPCIDCIRVQCEINCICDCHYDPRH